MDADAVMAKYGVSPAQYPELAALVGEAADNLPGVPGVGPGFAAKWLTQYGDLDGVLAHADEIKGKKGEALRAHLDDVRRNRRLNALVRDLDLPIGLEAMALEMPEREPVEELFDALQFNRIRERVFEVFSERIGETAPAAQVEEAPEFTEAATAQDVADFLAAEAGNLLGVHVDVEGPALLPKRKVPVPGTFGTAVGVALVGEHAGLHVSLDADAPDPALLAALREALGEGGLSKAVHDLKRVLKAIAEPAEATALEAGTPLDGVVDDVLLSAYLIQPDRRDTSLEALAEAHLHTPLAAPREPAEADAQGAFDLDGGAAAAERAARAADAVRAAWVVRRLSVLFTPQVLERGAQRLLQELEIPLARLLARIELTGIAVDAQALETLRADFSEAAAAAQESAWASVAEETGG